MTEQELQKLDKNLEKEEKSLVDQLNRIANKNPLADGDFSVRVPSYGDEDDENAQEITDLDKNFALEQELESKLNSIRKTREKIKDETYLSKIMENIVFSNLLCHIVSSGYDITNTLFYWRSKTQEEIDFLVYVRKGTKKTIIPIEVKYQNAAFSRLATFQPIFLTKNEYDEKARKIPLALFLFQLPQRVKI